MASKTVMGILGGLAAASVTFGSTTASASPLPVQQPDPWALLTAMSGGAPAATMCGAAAAAAAAQAPPGGCVLPVLDTPAPPPVAGPPPPLLAAAPAAGISPLIIGLVAIAAGLGVFLAVHNNGHGNSPA